MKKLLLSLGLLSATLCVSATDYRTGAKLTAAPTTETKVILEGWTQAQKGFMVPPSNGTNTFAILDKSDANRVVFTEDYVYTLVPVEGSTTDFYIKDNNGNYAPICTINMNTGDGKHVPGATNIAEAGTYKIGASSPITTAAYSDKAMLTNTNQNCSGASHIEVHFADVNSEHLWCYLSTGGPGMADAGNSGRTACAFAIYEAEECVPVDITFNFPAFGGFQPAAKTITLFAGPINTADIPLPEYFTLTGIDKESATAATTVTVSGTWDFPFALNRVFRADLRKSNAEHCSKWAVNADNQISTRSNTDAEVFDPQNLFYLKGIGFNNDNRLQVTLHSLAYDDNYGFNIGNTNPGSITDAPTTLTVKTNSQSTAADPGISLQHPANANWHLNDISGKLGAWQNALSQNDIGSFIRFFDLTEEDFATAKWNHNGEFLIFDAEKIAAAKADPTSEKVREVFATASPAPAINLTVNLKHNGRLIETTTVSGIDGEEVSVPAPAFFTDEITVTIPAADGTVDYDLTGLALPFKHTETTDNLVWQIVHMHVGHADTAYTWTFDQTDSDTMVAVKPEDTATNGYADTQLWAFVGNMAEGFKVYNKEAGTSQWLYEEGTGNNQYVKVGTTEAGSIWKPVLSATQSDATTYCCLSTNGSNFVNLNTNKNNGTSLTHWTDADNGSTIWFEAACEAMLPTASAFDYEPYDGPLDAVGAVDFNGVDFSDAEAILAAANADKYDVEAAEGLRDLIARYTSNVTVNTLEPNGYYRIENIEHASQYMYTATADNDIYSKLFRNNDYRNDYHTIFKFEAVEGQADRYYLLSQGHYVGHVYGTDQNDHHGPVQTTVAEERGEYSLVSIDHVAHPNENKPNVDTRVAFALKDMTQSDYNFLHQGGEAGENSSYRISAWRQWAHGSHFYVHKATDIAVNLTHSHNDMNIGFGYFPFAVSAADDDTKLYYVHESSDKETGEPVITYSEVASVPAHTAFMVSHKSADSALLNIGAESAANARRRVVSADDTNNVYDGFADTDSWTGTSWTKAGENVPEQITALGVNAANVRYMARSMKFNEGGDLTVEFVYTGGNHRIDVCGVVLLNAEGEAVVADYHKGYSGTYKDNNVYTLKVPAAGTYTLRYYAYNADDALSTNGDINLTFVTKDHTNLLEGYLRQGQAQSGDFVFGTTSKGAGFTKATEATDVAGNYVYIPATKLYHQNLAETTEIPLVPSETTTTEISEINVEQPAAKVIFDLQGRRLNAPVKGINIVNGAKVLVK